MLIRLLFIGIFFSCSTESYKWYKGNLYEALSLIQGTDKIILLDFYADGWGGCVRLDAETLSNQEVIQFSNQNLVSLKLTPWEKKEDSDLLEKYNGRTIPLLIFLNNKKEEIDRILGFYPAAEYLDMIKNIYNGNDTYLSLKEKYQEGESNSLILSKLAMKCSDNREPDFCRDIYTQIINTSNIIDEDILFKAELFFASEKLSSGDIQSITDLLDKYKNTDKALDLYSLAIQHFAVLGEIASEAKYYKEMSDTFKDNPSLLNGYAWRMTELGLNLEDALEKSILAIDIADDIKLKSYILDTKAELLWLLGRIQEAINTINLAIEIDPNSDYFKEQKQKFKDF